MKSGVTHETMISSKGCIPVKKNATTLIPVSYQ